MSQPDKTELLRAMSNPSSVAIIGASNSPGKLQSRPMRFMKQHGYSGTIYPINPTHQRILDEPAYASIESVEADIDHAYILLDTDAAIAALHDCARAGVKVVSLLADGFAEAGPAGMARQEKVAAIAREAGILLIGPNSTGLVDTRSGFSCTTNAAFATESLPTGRLAVLSQSGSLIGSIFSRGAARGLAFSTLISVGNEAASGVGEIGSLLLEDPGTDAVLLFMETIRQPERLSAFARRAHDLGKPVVCYMIGRSTEGQNLSVSHTGAMTGSAKAIASYLRAIGIEQVENFETLLESPAALIKTPMPAERPRTVTVVSTTGGGGAMVIDRLSERGAAITGCSPASRDHLTAKNIPLGHGKLIDVTLAGARYEIMKEVVSTLASDPTTGVLVVAIGSSAQFQPELAVSPIIDAVAELREHTQTTPPAPVLAFPLPQADQSLQLLANAGIPAFRTLESCAESISMVLNPARPQIDPLPPALPAQVIERLDSSLANAGQNSLLLNEVESGQVFAALGIEAPPQRVIELEDALPECDLPAFPIVAKLVSNDLPHKSDAGALALNLQSVGDLATAISAMKSAVSQSHPDVRLQAVLVQTMQSGVAEMLVGLSRDPLVGPVVTVGFGGTATEIYQDAVCRPAPVSARVAQVMLTELRGYPLLDGYRGAAPADQSALINAIVAVSTLARHPAISEAEINPLLVRQDGHGVVLLDALIKLEKQGES